MDKQYQVGMIYEIDGGYYWPYRCEGCGQVYDRAHGPGKHTKCENRVVRENRTPEQKTRRRWEAKSNDVSPIVFERDSYECKHCGTSENLTVDHITPIIKGGTNDLSNLQTLCGSCNSKKGGR